MSLDEKGICPEEKKPQSKSPFGVVGDGEVLARVVPLSMVVGDIVSKSALMIKDLTENDGWSFVRQDRTADMECVMKHMKGNNAPKCRCAIVETSQVRGIKNSLQEQALCVIDDAQENFPEHALAKQSVKYERADVREIRSELLRRLKLKR